MRPVALVNRHPQLRLDRRGLLAALHALDTHFVPTPSLKRRAAGSVVPPGELSLVFLTDPALAQLHADFLQDPSPTDVITFSGDPGVGWAGEICISVDAALRHCRAGSRRQVRPQDFAAELTLYVVHGWLHLAGYDDLEPAKKRAMRRAEAKALALLRRHDAMPKFALKPAA